MKLNIESIKNKGLWGDAGIILPEYDITKIRENTKKSPIWIHFGTGNIFRGFIAALQHKLLKLGLSDKGIIATESFGFSVMEKIFSSHDNLNLLVEMGHQGQITSEVIGSIVEIVETDSNNYNDWHYLKEVFKNPSLQMVSFTITEKGYVLKKEDGSFLDSVKSDMEKGPAHASHSMAVATSMLYERYKNGKHPIALVSMDNCSQNGKVLKDSIVTIAKAWIEKGFANPGFLCYLEDNHTVTFPWTMIDKITPGPSKQIKQMLENLGLEGMDIVSTGGGSKVAPFVNAEVTEYLIVEDNFPNGRPPLEKAGVIFTDQDTVRKAEKMKVGTCLNPLHTALAIFGCLFGYRSIADEMKDEDLVLLIKKIAYDEAMPVVVDPKIIDPETFVREVIEVRFPNPHIPDTPERIATDTSQKIPVRFGGTLQAYQNSKNLDISSLIFIPMVFAAWLRYLLGLDDEGREMVLSPDPLMDLLKSHLEGVKLGSREYNREKLSMLLKNESIFSMDLCEAGLADKVLEIFQSMITEAGGVRKTLRRYLY